MDVARYSPKDGSLTNRVNKLAPLTKHNERRQEANDTPIKDDIYSVHTNSIVHWVHDARGRVGVKN